MNIAVRRFCQSIPVLRDLYQMARQGYQVRRAVKSAAGYFLNLDEYRGALEIEDGKIVDLRTRDGLVFSIRRNYMDATVLAEIFLDNCYVRDLTIPERPVVVDIGGYIGDFAIYAVKYLNARKVVVCEPSPRNWALLQKNVINNHYEANIEMVNKAVTSGEDTMLNIDAPDRGQARVSAYYGTSIGERRMVPGIALDRLMEEHEISIIDLLKIDCEGGEYSILLSTPGTVLERIRNLVFEYHEIDGFEEKLTAVKQRLYEAGFSLRNCGSIISGSRG